MKYVLVRHDKDGVKTVVMGPRYVMLKSQVITTMQGREFAELYHFKSEQPAAGPQTNASCYWTTSFPVPSLEMEVRDGQ
jgi:hypothetical protein